MSKYFSADEITCNCGCGRGLAEINPMLLECLDELRERWGAEIFCSCMYRCPEHNRDVGGEPNSQHLLGNAADIYVNGDYHEFYRFVINSRLFDAIGYYPQSEFVHADIRSGCTEINGYWWCGE